MRICKDYGNIKKAKVLVIGHDPRLKLSDDIAEYCFYADYKFKADIKDKKDKRKKEFSKAVYDYIFELTNNKYNVDEIYFTNLCNDELPHAPKKKTVYIPIDKAKEGIKRIKDILNNSDIEFIFAMSLQVNYWLQELGFYSSNNEFLKNTIICDKGKLSINPYFKTIKSGTFKEICGNIYTVDGSKAKIIPILHVTQYPLRSFMKNHYGESLETIKCYFQ